MSNRISEENLRICPICNAMYDASKTTERHCIKCKNNLNLEDLYLCTIVDFETYLKMIRSGEVKAYKKLYKEKNNNIQSANLPKCPICGSTNLKKLSFTNKAVSVGVFGLLSNKINKTWECRNCRSTF